MSKSQWHRFYNATITAPPELLFGLLSDMPGYARWLPPRASLPAPPMSSLIPSGLQPVPRRQAGRAGQGLVGQRCGLPAARVNRLPPHHPGPPAPVHGRRAHPLLLRKGRSRDPRNPLAGTRPHDADRPPPAPPGHHLQIRQGERADHERAQAIRRSTPHEPVAQPTPPRPKPQSASTALHATAGEAPAGDPAHPDAPVPTSRTAPLSRAKPAAGGYGGSSPREINRDAPCARFLRTGGV